jgi:predicted lipoprotein with Yx(FWY)xxD motif
MPRPLNPDGRRPASRWARWTALSVAALAGFAVAAVAGIAVAKTFTLTIAKNVKVGSKRESIVANSRGVALYWLGTETTHHLVCTGQCLSFWPPLTLSSAGAKLSKQAGIKGALTTIKRGRSFQVVLAGHPLYRFKEDNDKAGVANGNGIKFSASAIWHVIPTSDPGGSGGRTTTTGTTTSASTSSGSTTTTTSSSSTCTYYCY